MDMKDQRIELRLPQQQLEELDNFIAEIDSQYKPSRSDVLRSFIAQGVQGKFTPGGQGWDTFPPEARLNIFFQLSQLQRASGQKPEPLSRSIDNQRYMIPDYTESTVTAETLVRAVYLQRLTWFFELDEESIKLINRNLWRDEIQTLMMTKPKQANRHQQTLNVVIRLRDMYQDIRTVMKEAEGKKYQNEEIQKTLTRIEGYAEDNGVPLVFLGYPDKEVWKQHAEMHAMLDWIEQGQGFYRINSDPYISNQDYTTKYQTMLQIYGDVSHEHRFDLNALLAMVKDRRL